MRYKIVPIFIPHASCENQCIFCNQKEITATSGYDYGSVKATLEKAVPTLAGSDARREIAFYGGSFTAIAPETQEKLLSLAKGYIDSGDIDAIRISTRPDCIDTETLKRLRLFGVKTIELGIQSMSDAVLSLNGRGHTVGDNVRASKLVREHGFTLGHQIMPGLHGDTPETMLMTADESIALGPDFLRVYPCLVVKGTRLEAFYNSGEYVPLSLDEAVGVCKTIYLKAAKAGVEIIRMGLHAERDFVQSGIVAGPFHPAFRHLVMSALFVDLTELMINCTGLTDGDVVFGVNKSDVSNFSGIKKSNILRIKEKFSLKSVKVIAEDNIKRGGISLNFLRAQLSGNILDLPARHNYLK